MVPLRWNVDESDGLDSDVLLDNVPLHPLLLVNGAHSFELTGGTSFEQLTGDVEGSDGSRGAWDLAQVSLETLREGAEGLREVRAHMEDWLAMKAEYLELKREQEWVAERLQDRRDGLQKLQTFVSDEKKLEARAKERLEKLQLEFKELQKKKSTSVNAVGKLVSELDLLGRITKRGKAVDLARRVASREAKWYQANWRAAEDPSGLEEFVASNAKIDLKELQRRHKEAQEKRNLEMELASERQRIQALQSSSGDEAAEATSAQGRRGKRGFWNRLWGRIK